MSEAEAPLIAEEAAPDRGPASSGGHLAGAGGSGSGSGQSSKKYRRRSDALAYGDRYQKAAALVDLAEDGVGVPEDVLNDTRFEKAMRFYFVYLQLDWLWSLNLFALILLNFLEKPLWCRNDAQHACDQRDLYFLGQLPYFSKTESLIYEGVTLVILVLDIFCPLSYEGLNIFWNSTINKLKVLLLFILACDILVFAFSAQPFRVAPYIRVVFLIMTIRELRMCAVTLYGLLGTYLNVLALSTLFLLFASWVAYVTFEDTLQGKTIFTSYGETMYQMFVLFTTSNNPDVWVPAYKISRWYSLFFIVYVLLGVYFLTNLILAVIYDSFKEQFAKQLVQVDSIRRSILQKAFGLIDTAGQGYLDREQCISLLNELNKYRSLPKTSREDFELIFTELDRSGDFKVTSEEFADLCNTIAIKFQKEPPPSYLEKFPFYHSPLCETLKSFVRSRLFDYIIVFVLLMNLVAVIIETTLDIENSSSQEVWQEVEFFLGCQKRPNDMSAPTQSCKQQILPSRRYERLQGKFELRWGRRRPGRARRWCPRSPQIAGAPARPKSPVPQLAQDHRPQIAASRSLAPDRWLAGSPQIAGWLVALQIARSTALVAPLGGGAPGRQVHFARAHQIVLTPASQHQSSRSNQSSLVPVSRLRPSYSPEVVSVPASVRPSYSPQVLAVPVPHDQQQQYHHQNHQVVPSYSDQGWKQHHNHLARQPQQHICKNGPEEEEANQPEPGERDIDMPPYEQFHHLDLNMTPPEEEEANQPELGGEQDIDMPPNEQFHYLSPFLAARESLFLTR